MKRNWEDKKQEIKCALIEGDTYQILAERYKSSTKTIKKVISDLNLTQYYHPIFKCKYCGKEFDDIHKFSGHVSSCSQSPKHQECLKNLENARKNIKYESFKRKEQEYHCKFCGKITHNKGALAVHEKACEQNPNREKCANRIGNGGVTAGHIGWCKGKTIFDDERLMKSYKIRKQNYVKGLWSLKGRKHTDETKRILREKMIEYIKKNGNGTFGQRYSIKACEYIKSLNEKMNWNLQHALDGGEKQICGYFLDGYNENLNIAFEYDEPKHYIDVYENILCERDIRRQNEIIKELGCEFYRYNEKLDKLYKI